MVIFQGTKAFAVGRAMPSLVTLKLGETSLTLEIFENDVFGMHRFSLCDGTKDNFPETNRVQLPLTTTAKYTTNEGVTYVGDCPCWDSL